MSPRSLLPAAGHRGLGDPWKRRPLRDANAVGRPPIYRASSAAVVAAAALEIVGIPSVRLLPPSLATARSTCLPLATAARWRPRRPPPRRRCQSRVDSARWGGRVNEAAALGGWCAAVVAPLPRLSSRRPLDPLPPLCLRLPSGGQRTPLHDGGVTRRWSPPGGRGAQQRWCLCRYAPPLAPKTPCYWDVRFFVSLSCDGAKGTWRPRSHPVA